MFRAIKEYKISVSGTPSAPLALPVPVDGGVVERSDLQYRMRAKGCDVVVLMSDGTEQASASVSSSARPDRNFSIADGAIELFGDNEVKSHISVVSEDGSSSGALIVTLGVGED